MSSTKKSQFRILRKPLTTEKTAVAGSSGNCYVFEVHPEANKQEIRDAVEKIFEVKVKAVRTLNCLGKVRRRGKVVGRERAWKKAYVSLIEGNAIDLVEGL